MINIYTEKEIKIMAEGGTILAKIMKELTKEVKPGITTEYLNKVASDLIFSYGVKPSFKGFNNYPAVLCTSINEEIVHAVPSKRVLKNGDILSLDLGIKYNGYCTDLAITLLVLDKKVYPPKFFEEKLRRAKKLINVTKKSLELAIKQCKSDNHLEDIGFAIQNYVEKNKFNVIRDLVGHGVGKNVHEDPQILNYGPSTPLRINEGIKLKPGMILALEPMTSMGKWEIETCEDGFGFRTKDHSLSAHFEHTIAITKKGPKNLTKI